jgi:ribonuclease P protein component
VLPAAARLRRRAEFAEVVRRGRRTARGPLVLHALIAAPVPAAVPVAVPVAVPADLPAESPAADGSPRIGFVVGKVVGPAVVRNRLRRRLRHLLSARLGPLPAGLRLVVRARPGAGELSSAELGALLDAGLPAVTTARS